MPSAELFRIVGQIAGIGGLVVLIFAFIVREVLRKVPPPPGVTERPFMSMINRIILFSFIITIIGMLIFLILTLVQQVHQQARTASRADTRDRPEARGGHPQV